MALANALKLDNLTAVDVVRIVQITPGAGGMYCGGCLRDNALAGALRAQGHPTLLVPLYLPMTLDEPSQAAGQPVFYGGVSVYLDQKLPFFRHAPDWVRRALAHPAILRWASGKAARTRPEETGDLTLSMLRGEEGRQARELEELIGWLKESERPELVCLSNGLLVGLARRLKSALGVPVVCTLQGEDYFLDGLPENQRKAGWALASERAADVDLFVAPSEYYGRLMARRLGIPSARMRVAHNGIDLAGYPDTPPEPLPGAAALGFLGRMCREKGLDLLVDAYLQLRGRPGTARLKLRVAGSLGAGDTAFVAALKRRLAAAGCMEDVEFHPNLDHAAKVAFLRGLSVMSTPALYGEAFGLYVIEALAAGVPVVQPRVAAFPELLEAAGGGLLCEPNAAALAGALETLLLDPAGARELGRGGQAAARALFSVEAMARRIAAVYEEALERRAGDAA